MSEHPSWRIDYTVWQINLTTSEMIDKTEMAVGGNFDVDVPACRGRQRRFVEQLSKLELDTAILTRRESIQWLTGAYVGKLFEMATLIDQGQVTLIVPAHLVDAPLAADNIVPYDAQRLATLRDDQRRVITDVLLDNRSRCNGRVGCERAYLSTYLSGQCKVEWIDVESVLLRLRRRKEADELRMLARANEANLAMYEHARQAIRPDVNELDLYRQLHSVAVQTLGEPLTYFGQDFQSNSMGGPPRDKAAQANELWILDLGVGFRGFYSDNCRTIAVVGEPDPMQRRAHEAIRDIFLYVETTICPGTSCRDLYHEVRRRLDECAPWSFPHHLGHGVGLMPHEAPRLNPNWDESFEVGDYFTVEPGLYHDELQYGIRLEQNYVVTEHGVKLLTDWPLDL